MVDVKLTFETNGGNPPVSPLCSGKQTTETLDKDDVGKTDNAAILSELARVKAAILTASSAPQWEKGDG